MKALGVIPGRREVQILEHNPPHITLEDQVLVRSLEVGICGTDREICSFAYGTPPAGSEYLVLGHESLGEVLDVGPAVSKLRPGTLVVPSVRRPCHHPQCLPCRKGRQDFCATGDFTERGIKMRHGYITERYVESERYLIPIPQRLRDVGVLVEPLTVTEKALAQVWQMQQRLPWVVSPDPEQPGRGLRAVVLGAGPVGILGAMALLSQGFETCVYSRSLPPNLKAELVESLGAKYISSKAVTPQQLAEKMGNIDLIYEAAGAGPAAFDLLSVLGINGVCVFTGIPAPKPAVEFELDRLMRQLVLKNQVAIGTVNADLQDFHRAAEDLARFYDRWPGPLRQIITGRHPLQASRELLLGNDHGGRGIKDVIALV